MANAAREPGPMFSASSRHPYRPPFPSFAAPRSSCFRTASCTLPRQAAAIAAASKRAHAAAVAAHAGAVAACVRHCGPLIALLSTAVRLKYCLELTLACFGQSRVLWHRGEGSFLWKPPPLPFFFCVCVSVCGVCANRPPRLACLLFPQGDSSSLATTYGSLTPPLGRLRLKASGSCGSWQQRGGVNPLRPWSVLSFRPFFLLCKFARAVFSFSPYQFRRWLRPSASC